MYLVISCSLHPTSRSRLLARRAAELLTDSGEETRLVDLREFPLPACDGATCYADANVVEIGRLIREARGVLLASPIYNFDLNAAAKNLVELTGRNAWQEQVVGFLCAAGGRSSYMAVMGLANSLMLDFRTFIIPRFVYAGKDSFDESSVSDPEIEQRLLDLTGALIRISQALRG